MNRQDTMQAKTGLNTFFAKIYGFLALGIGISALVTFLLFNVFTGFFATILSSTGLFLSLCVLEFVLVIYLGAKAQKNPSLAIAGFVLYAVVNGITLSALLLYTQTSIFGAFLSAAATFGAMALVGIFTKKDLSRLGHAAYSALIGIIIAMLLNVFLLHSSAVELFISLLTVIVFSGITAYDNQNISRVYAQADGQVGTGVAVFFALQLYLDLINLFLAFLKIFGKNN